MLIISLHLSNFFQNIRVAAMDCIDSLYTLWCHFEHAGKKNGNVRII